MHIFCSVLFLGNEIFGIWEFKMVLIFRVQLWLIFTLFLLNNLWNLWWRGKCFLIRFRNIFSMLVFPFLLYGGLNQMIFLFRWFLLLAASIFALYLSLCLNPDLSEASWHGITEAWKISSVEDNDESRDSIESGSCLMIDGGWLDSMFIYFIWLFDHVTLDKDI